MNTTRGVRLADRLYRVLLRAMRVARSSEEASAIGADGRQLLEDARAQGRSAMVVTWARLVGDLVTTGLRQDLSTAARMAARAPGFTLSTALVLAVGLTATTTMFVLIDGVLLRPLPYPGADRVVMLWETNAAQSRVEDGPSPGNLLDWKARSGTFSHVAAWSTVRLTLRDTEGGLPVTAAQVTGGFFEVFGMQPLIGRTFMASEFDGVAVSRGQYGGREPALVLSHRLWRDLGGGAELVGGTVSVDGRKWRVLGVMPRDFDIPHHAALWMPWDLQASYAPDRFPAGPPRDFRFLRAAARLNDGVTPDLARTRMHAVAAQLEVEHPDVNRGWSVRLTSLTDDVLGPVRSGLTALFAAVALLLGLTAANIAGLMVARTLERTQELAVRRALGADQSRILRQLGAEAFLIALVAAAIAIGTTALSLDAVVALLPEGVPRVDQLSVDGRVMGVAVMLAFVTALVAVVLTATLASRSDLAPLLKSGARTTRSGAARIPRALVVGELALALVLLVGAGLLVRSWVALQAVPPGFDQQNVVVLRVAVDQARDRTAGGAAEYYRRVVAALETLPSVTSVAAVTELPMSDVGASFDRAYWPEGPRPVAPLEADIRMATPAYFRTLRRPIVAGREFEARDHEMTPRVIVINESLARRTWPGHEPIGQRLVIDYLGGAYEYEIVGVAADARYEGLKSDPRPEIFIPHAQNPYLAMNVIARTSVPPEGVLQMARAKALEVDPNQAVHSATTMAALIRERLAADRLAVLVLVAFSVMGVVVAAAGVHALMARTVTDRRREIALRMALGAAPRAIMWSVIRQSLAIALAGAGIGLLATLATGRIASSFLFGVAPSDPLTLAAVLAVLASVVIIAAIVPARHAMSTDPVVMLRT